MCLPAASQQSAQAGRTLSIPCGAGAGWAGSGNVCLSKVPSKGHPLLRLPFLCFQSPQPLPSEGNPLLGLPSSAPRAPSPFLPRDIPSWGCPSTAPSGPSPTCTVRFTLRNVLQLPLESPTILEERPTPGGVLSLFPEPPSPFPPRDTLFWSCPSTAPKAPGPFSHWDTGGFCQLMEVTGNNLLV